VGTRIRNERFSGGLSCPAGERNEMSQMRSRQRPKRLTDDHRGSDRRPRRVQQLLVRPSARGVSAEGSAVTRPVSMTLLEYLTLSVKAAKCDRLVAAFEAEGTTA